MLNILKINKSASRTISLLNLLSTSSKSLNQLEISKELDIPKSSTYELIYTLLDQGIIEFDNKELRTFQLSLKIFEIGMTVLDRIDSHKISRSLLEDLNLNTGETVFMAVEDKGSIVYIDRVEKNTSIRTNTGLGTRRPIHCTGLGKALMATYSMERIKEIWDARDPKAIYTDYTIIEYNDLIKELQLTRKRGYAIDNREIEDEIFCVAAPIYDRTDKAVGAISVASIYLKMDVARTEMFGKMVMYTALEISKRLGFRKNQIY